jgi:transposase
MDQAHHCGGTLVGAQAAGDSGGERAAAMYSLIETAKLNGIDPQAYLRHVLSHIAEYPINRINELLPWNVAQASITQASQGPIQSG